MFRRTRPVLPVAALLLVGTGCGSLANHFEPGSYLNGRGYTPYRPYGGVLVDGDMAYVNARRAVGLEAGYGSPDPESALAAAGFLFVDLPLSAVADTILLPLDVTNTLMGKGRPPKGGWPLLHIPEQVSSTRNPEPIPGNALSGLADTPDKGRWGGSSFPIEQVQALPK